MLPVAVVLALVAGLEFITFVEELVGPFRSILVGLDVTFDFSVEIRFCAAVDL